MTTIIAHRTHEWHMGHRVFEHESKCQHLHGHSYVATLHVEAPALDRLGRVMDFSVIKEKLVNWIEDNWDHKFMVFDKDPLATPLLAADPIGVIKVGFNPTAENIAEFLLTVVGPNQLAGTEVKLVKVELMETGKCGVVVTL